MMNILDNVSTRSKKAPVMAAMLLAIALMVITGCFGGSSQGDSASETTITRASRTQRSTSASRTVSSNHETATSESHETSSSDHAVGSGDDNGSGIDTGHGSDSAVAVSHTESTADDAHADTSHNSDAETSHGTDTDPSHEETDSGAHEEAEHGPAHWEYTGAVGQNYWGLLEEDFNSCVDGSAQSPIDVRDTLVTDLQDIKFHYNPALLAISNNGHTIQASYGKTDQGDGGYMIVDDEEFQLLQFHFHRPSEHTVNGHQAAMEMHLVHKSANGTLAVVGVLIEPGTFNTQIEPIWAVMPNAAGTEVAMDTLVDVNKLLPQDQRTYRYPGSLTTPPCSEGVKWNLMKTPISVSSGQVDAFKELYFFNARYTQPLNGREILEDASVGK